MFQNPGENKIEDVEEQLMNLSTLLQRYGSYGSAGGQDVTRGGNIFNQFIVDEGNTTVSLMR